MPTHIGEPNPGDVLEFFDGEGFVSGTYKESSERLGMAMMKLRVGDENQWVHESDVVAILRRKDE